MIDAATAAGRGRRRETRRPMLATARAGAATGGTSAHHPTMVRQTAVKMAACAATRGLERPGLSGARPLSHEALLSVVTVGPATALSRAGRPARSGSARRECTRRYEA
jgi:hypothetical protein